MVQGIELGAEDGWKGGDGDKVGIPSVKGQSGLGGVEVGFTFNDNYVLIKLVPALVGRSCPRNWVNITPRRKAT